MGFLGIRIQRLKHLSVGVHPVEIALEQGFVVHRGGEEEAVFRDELPAMSLEVTRVGVVALRPDVDDGGMGQRHHGFQSLHILRHKGLSLNDIIHDRFHLE